MARLSLLLCSIMLSVCTAQAAVKRAIMEGTAATSNTIFIDTTNVRVGIGDASPSYRLDVAGDIRSTGTIYGTGSSLTGVATSVQLTSTASALTAEISRAVAREDGIGASTGTIYAALNSTGSALTAEIARATARENAIAVSTGVLQVDLATEVSRATIRENDLGVSTGTTYAALNSTAAALTSEISRATTREDAIAASTGTLETSKVSRAGDTMTGNLIVGASVQANVLLVTSVTFGGDATFSRKISNQIDTDDGDSINIGVGGALKINETEVISQSRVFTGYGSGLSNLQSMYLTGTVPTGLINLSTVTSVLNAHAAALSTAVYTASSYSDPAWLTSLATSKVNLSTVTANHVLKAGDTMTGPLTLSGSAMQLRFLDTATGKDWKIVQGITDIGNEGLSVYDDITDATRLVITETTGNVGIGDTAPQAKLVVNGNTVSSGTVYAQNGFYGSGIGITFIPQTSVDLSTVTTALDGKLANDATVSPALIDLSTVTANHVLKAGDTMAGPLTLSGSTLTVTGNSGKYGLEVSSGVSLAGLLYTTNGNVGIGETAPGSKLHVIGDATIKHGLTVGTMTVTGGGTFGGNLQSSGTIQAVSFHGSGANLTNLPGPTSGMLFVASHVVTAAAGEASFYFDGLDIRAHEAYYGLFSGTSTVANMAVSVYLNTDTTPSNYDHSLLWSNKTAHGAAGGDTAKVWDHDVYNDSQGYFILQLDPKGYAQSNCYYTQMTIDPNKIWLTTFHNAVETNITKLTFQSSSGNGFSTGYSVMLYKIDSGD